MGSTTTAGTSDPNAALAAAMQPKVSTPTAPAGASPAAGASSTAGAGGGANTAANILAELGAGYSTYNAINQGNQQAAMFNDIRQPSVTAGKNYLNNATSGTLTPSQQNQANALNSQGNALANQASPFLAAGAQGLQQYESGQLPQWQQQQLDNQTAAAIAQARASMGPNVDSSTMASMEQNIRSQASIAQGQMLQQNLKTATDLYTLGANTQKEAFALIDAGYQSVITNLQQDFADAMAAFTQGDASAANMVNTQLQNDQRLSSALSKLIDGMGSLTAKTAMSGNSSVSDAIKKLSGFGNDSNAAPAGTSTNDTSYGQIPDIPAFSGMDSSQFSDNSISDYSLPVDSSTDYTASYDTGFASYDTGF